MDILLNPIGWLIIGAVAMIAELIIPGGVVFFLGAACVLVAGAIYFGLVTSWVSALTLFFISSLVLVVALRMVVSRFTEGDSTVANTDEILDDIDHFVPVIETIGPADRPGKVRFRGTSWHALGEGEEIPVGTTVRIVSRENISLLVEPVDPIARKLSGH
ncbi:MAG: NfeD family protein [Proteobacteria bacterium]|nr:NfeD family protein [Pseudomonadota bacterium]MDA1299647.1 NfeD family protein [Pseudomonadota bacterium]